MYTTNLNSVSSFVANLTRGTFGITMVTITTPRLLGGKKNPYMGRVKKVNLLNNVALGYGYESNVNIRLERNGISDEFVAEKPNGKHWVQFPYILQADKDESKYYLRCTMRSSMKSHPVYLCDGRLATAEELEEIKSYLPKPSASKKQMDMGLSEEETVKPFDYGLDGVVFIKQGAKQYVSDSYSVSELETFLKEVLE